jgi:membrane protease YdiL (CAAX protease family)
MFTKLTDTNKAAIFAVLVLCLAVGAALSINALGLSGIAMAGVWSITPVVATLIMLLVVTREGYSKEGWKSLGLHRLGLSVWWIAFGVSLLVSVVAAAIVWTTPLASFVVPEGGILMSVLNAAIKLLLQVCVVALPFMLSEEIGMRGYLQPRLMSLGRRGALLVVGLLWATWHMPLILLTPIFPVGNKLISLPLFYGAVVAGSFFYGYLRIYTGSVWPSTIAHGVHNHAWGILGVFTATSSPVIVNKYLGGDYGILIVVGGVIAAIWVGHRLKNGMDQAQSGADAEAPRVAPAHPSVPAAPTR